MTATDVTLVSLLLIMLPTTALLGAAEASFLRVQRVRVEVRAADGDHRSRRLLRLLDDLPRVLNTILLVVLLLQIGAATVTGMLSNRHFGNVGVTVASIVLTVALFVYTEAIPKTYAVHHPDSVARATVGLVAGLTYVFRPAVGVLVAFADLQTPGTGITVPPVVSESELRKMAFDAAATGAIDETDRDLIDRAFALGDRTVDEIVIPRTEVVAVRVETPIRDALDTAIRSGHRRLPVFDEDLDSIRGVVHLKDLAAAVIEAPTEPVSTITTGELVVPETKRVIDLLAEMQATGVHLAVAVDEYGGTAGIATIEDVVRELVGRVSDEGEVVSPPIRQIDHNHWAVDATVSVEDLESATGVALPDGDWHTAAGLVIGIAGHIPVRGETFRFDGLTLTVVEAEAHRVVAIEATIDDHDRSS